MVVDALSDNEVDGPTLVTLRKDELRTELGIASLPARRYLWDRIETLQKQQQTIDHTAALLLHRTEITGLESMNAQENLSTSTKVDSAVIEVLKSDYQKQVQSSSDHLYALRLHSNGNMSSNLQSYEDADTAQEEQARLDALSIMSVYDHSVALQFQNQGRSTRPSTIGSDETSLFKLCIDACVRHQINVSKAFASGIARPIPRYRGTNDYSQPERQSEPAIPTRSSAGNHVSVPSTGQRHAIAAWNRLQELPLIDQCHVCYAEKERGFTLACDHSQCVDCMTRHLRVALHDRSLLPLKCCEIPIEMSTLSEMLLRPTEQALLAVRTQEVTAINKMYCPKCSRFINLDLVDRDPGADSILLCECRQLLCVECKTAAHPALTCRENKQATSATDDELVKLAASEGWKQCPRCSIMIELSYGCFHMTCSNCTHEFCFRCLSDWNNDLATCSTGNCPIWEERRLIQAAELRVDADLAAPVRRVAAARARAPAARVVDPEERKRHAGSSWQ